MIFRWLLGIGITSFWLVMMGLLFKTHYYPEGSEMAVAQPELVMERFLSSGEESALDIWRGNEIVGSLKFEPRRSSRKSAGKYTRYDLHTRGVLGLTLPGSMVQKVVLDSMVRINAKSEISSTVLSLELPGAKLRLDFRSGGDEKVPVVVITSAGSEIFNSEKAAQATPGNESKAGLAALLGKAFGLDIEAMTASSSAQTTQVTTVARRGSFEVRGKKFNGYIQTTSIGAGRDFTLYLGESGDVVQMRASFMDYQFISQDLRPEGVAAYGMTQTK